MNDVDEQNWYTEEIATLGDRIAAAREARSMTVNDLAQKLGVAVQTVEDWEHDLSEPRANKMQFLSGVLHVSLRWLLTGEGEDVASMGDGAVDVGAAVREIRTLRAELTQTLDRVAQIEQLLSGEMAVAAE